MPGAGATLGRTPFLRPEIVTNGERPGNAGTRTVAVPPLQADAMNTQEVATRLVELCRAGKYEQAQNEL